MASPSQLARPRSFIRGSRVQGDVRDSRADGKTPPPRTRGRTTRPGNTPQFLDPAVAGPTAVPTAPAGYSQVTPACLPLLSLSASDWRTIQLLRIRRYLSR